MSIKDHKVERNQGVSALLLPLCHGAQVPASQADLEVISFRLPSITDWYIVSAYVFARAIGGTPDVTLQDDGSDIGSDTAIVAGAQTVITGAAGTTIAGGSELQVLVTTAGGETVDDLVVSLHLEPLYLYARTASTTPS